MSKKFNVLITGGSGFIGTNLMQYYLEKGCNVLNLDIVAPKNKEHLSYWKRVNLLDLQQLKMIIDFFAPDYLIHLGARTDLNEKNNINGYLVNYQGTQNLITAIKDNRTLKRVIFASSMLVCKVGYIPKNWDDYSPSTLYGQSKVMMEKVIKNSQNLTVPWVIVRPTSIWGPWFGEPYISLFKFITNKRYFLISDKSCVKTCGYVGNIVWQIDRLLFLEEKSVSKEIFYLGDKPYYNMADWAEEIANEFNNSRLKKLPYFIFKILATIGDILLKMGLNFSMTSFRLKNMTTDNMVPLEALYSTVGMPPYSRKEGIKKTLNFLWLLYS